MLQNVYEVVSASQRTLALSLLQKHGVSASSFQVLESGFQFYFDGDDAFVGYVDTGSAWVAAGAPVAPAERVAEVATHFREAARQQHRNACFFAAEEPFVPLHGWIELRVGEQPTWDPARWRKHVDEAASLRAQIKRAQNKGVVVRRVQVEELAAGQPLRVAMQNVADAWTSARDMAPMGFLVGIEPFAHAEEKRVWVAETNGKLVAFLSAVPIYARDGWLLEDLLRVKNAPNGTVELLIDAAMLDFAASGSKLVTMGMAPLSGEIPRGLRWIRELAKPLYDFGGVYAFKNKLRPDGWEPLYVLTPQGQTRTRALIESIRAFARGSIASFALQTFVRGPPYVLASLVLLLAVWIPFLALVPVDPWFPSAVIKTSWIVFDLLLVVLLLILARGYRSWLGILCASLVTMDATLTFVEGVVHNLPRIHSWGPLALTVVACAGPFLCANALWGLVRTQKEIAVRTRAVARHA